MSLGRIAAVLGKATFDPPVLALTWLGIGDCEGSKHHSPTPLLVRPHHLSDEVPNLIGSNERTGEDLVYLCSTCADNLTVYLSVLWAYDGATPHSVRRDFGNLIRDLGDRAWTHHLKRCEVTPV